MPLLLLSEVVRSIVVLSEYFEDNAQFQWMYETLMEVYKSFEKEDEILWPHLIYGIFYSASKIQLVSSFISTINTKNKAKLLIASAQTLPILYDSKGNRANYQFGTNFGVSNNQQLCKCSTHWFKMWTNIPPELCRQFTCPIGSDSVFP